MNELHNHKILIEDLLKCAICSQTFEGCPIVLSCCESTVCPNHVEDNEDASPSKRKLFTCVLCEKTHDVENSKKFAPNRTIEKLLTKDVFKELQIVSKELQMSKEINLGDIFTKTNEEIKKLKSSSQKLNDLIKDPKNQIFEMISKLKRDVDLRREKLKAKIDEISNQMIVKLDNYQQECYANIDTINLEEKTKDLVKEIESSLEEWTKDNKRILLVSNDLKRKEIHSKVIELDTQLFNRLNELKEELIMNRNWIYLENEKVTKEFEKELIQFEGMKNSIEFELKDFKSVFNQNKFVSGTLSPTYKYGEYNWYLKADVKKNKDQADEDLWFIFYLHCQSVNKSSFPLFANMKYSVLNKDKDSRKDFFKSLGFCYEKDIGKGYFMFKIKDLMNVENGYYDSRNDKVTIKVEFQFKKC